MKTLNLLQIKIQQKMKTTVILFALLASLFVLQSCENFEDVANDTIELKTIRDNVNTLMNQPHTVDEKTYERLLTFVQEEGFVLTKQETSGAEAHTNPQSGGERPF